MAGGHQDRPYRTDFARPFFSTHFARVCETILKENIMSAYWLLLLPVAGFAWSAVDNVVRALPRRNEDLTYF